jgi:thiazole synthase ThiGH ThiG subunit
MTTATPADMMAATLVAAADPFIFGGRSFASRLITGTGK